MRAEVEDWWRQAQADLAAAEYNFVGGHWHITSWCAQQAAEKGLKALFIERHQQLPPRTHIVAALGRAVGAPQDVLDELEIVEAAFELARYPDADEGIPVDRIDNSLAQEHLEAARRSMAWISEQLQQSLIGPS